MTTRKLQALAEEWKKILRVQDWETDIGLEDRRGLPAGTAGNNTYRIKLKLAKIDILDPKDEDPDADPEDPEETLVHELLHLHTAGFDNGYTGRLNRFQDMAMEQMVDSLAGALVKLKRARDQAYLEGRRDQLEETINILGRKEKRK